MAIGDGITEAVGLATALSLQATPKLRHLSFPIL